jgi:diketogulonate reductase-like aldo/keto reductase
MTATTTHPKLTINSTVKLSSGYEMPLLGFGVYQNYDTAATTLEAFKAGYRYAQCTTQKSEF